MRIIGALLVVVGLVSLLWACALDLTISPASGLVHNLSAAAGRNSAALWGFGLVVVGLLMRLSAPRRASGPAVSYETHRRCPACAEPVLRAASKCKHCGTAIAPEPLPPRVSVWREVADELLPRLRRRGTDEQHQTPPPGR